MYFAQTREERSQGNVCVAPVQDSPRRTERPVRPWSPWRAMKDQGRMEEVQYTDTHTRTDRFP